MKNFFRQIKRSKMSQRSTYSFYAHRSQKRKKIQLSHKYIFTLLGSASVKTVRRILMKLNPEIQGRLNVFMFQPKPKPRPSRLVNPNFWFGEKSNLTSFEVKSWSTLNHYKIVPEESSTKWPSSVKLLN